MRNPTDTTNGPARPAGTRHRSMGAAIGVALVSALALVACVPPTPVPPTVGAELTVTPDPDGVTAGSTITVDGTGFNPSGNLGTRPPFFGQPAGVYVVFGRFTEPWKPSEGAPGGNRQIIAQRWALPYGQYAALGGASNPELVLMEADGSFSTEIELTEVAGSGDYGIATYAGSGAVNSGEELFVPVSFAP